MPILMCAPSEDSEIGITCQVQVVREAADTAKGSQVRFY